MLQSSKEITWWVQKAIQYKLEICHCFPTAQEIKIIYAIDFFFHGRQFPSWNKTLQLHHDFDLANQKQAAIQMKK